jgi:hypothetical protein
MCVLRPACMTIMKKVVRILKLLTAVPNYVLSEFISKLKYMGIKITIQIKRLIEIHKNLLRICLLLVKKCSFPN